MKRQIVFAVLAAFFASLLWTSMAFAEAWCVPKYKVWGEHYTKFEYAKQEFTVEGKRRTLSDGQEARNWGFTMEDKLEFGATDWLNGIFNIAYKQYEYKEYGRPDSWGPFVRKNNGFSVVRIGGRLRLMKAPFAITTRSLFYIYPGYGNYHGDDPAYQNQPSLGYGNDSFEQIVSVGKTFDIPITKSYKLPCLLETWTGYRWSNRSVCGVVPYYMQFGFWPVKTLILKGELDGIMCNPGTGSIKESYGIGRLGAIWEVFGGDTILRQGSKLFNIEFLYGATLWGKNTTAYQEWTTKLDVQF